MTKYVPIDANGYRVPVSEWTRKDRITFDGALPRRAFDETDNDPEGTNSGYSQPETRIKKQEFANGALKNNYFPKPAEDDEDDDELSDELIEALCEHAGESLGFSEEMLKALRGKLGAKQAEDDDQPPNMVGGGQPQRGGGMSALKAGRPTIMNEQKAMDAERAGIGSFASRNPAAARISPNGFSNKRDPVPPSLALDATKPKRRGGSSFAERFPDAAKIKFCY